MPDERFFDAVEAVLHELDGLWLNDGRVSDGVVVSVREAFTNRLISTGYWRRLVSEPSMGIEFHLGGGLAAMFMAQHFPGQALRCYVLLPGAARTDVLLPILTPLAEQAAGSTFVALAFLSLLEVEPHPRRLTFLSRAVAAWWRAHGANAEFWADHGIGPRTCAWIDRALLQSSGAPEMLDVSDCLATVDVLVQCGTPLARALEDRIAARQKAAGA